MTKERIKQIEKEMGKFKGLDIGKFAYCETDNDYIIASYYGNSIEACIEVTKNKPKLKETHRKLIIFDSYCRELKDLGAFL